MCGNTQAGSQVCDSTGHLEACRCMGPLGTGGARQTGGVGGFGATFLTGGATASGGAMMMEPCVLNIPTPPPTAGGAPNQEPNPNVAGNPNAAGAAGAPAYAGSPATLGTGGASDVDNETAVRRALGAARLTLLLGEVQTLKARAGSAESAKLDVHLNSLHELHRLYIYSGSSAFDQVTLPNEMPPSPALLAPAPTSTAAPPPGGPGAALAPRPPRGPTVIRRLTKDEYLATLAALGFATAALTVQDDLPGTSAYPFDNLAANLIVAPIASQQYFDNAETLSATFTVPSCAPPALGADCAIAFITSFGKQAFRRPLTCAETQAYLDLYMGAYQAVGLSAHHAAGIRQIVATMLQSPNFLYRTELGAPGAIGETFLTSYEVAAELSYLYTGGPPDSELQMLADASTLQDSSVRAQQARRLLSTPQARPVVRHFVEQIFRIDQVEQVTRDPATYPLFTPTLAAAMHRESSRFIDYVLWESDGTFATLLNAPYTFVNSSLAQFYGLPDPGQGDVLVRVELPANQRMGLLTQASVMTANAPMVGSHPFRRGSFVRERLFCQAIPPPAVGTHGVTPTPDPGLSTRQMWANLTADPACTGCHSLFESIAFSLENYDAIGQYRTAERGFPIDASGYLYAATDVGGPYVGGVELAQLLSQSATAQQCFTTHAYSWAFGRSIGANLLPLSANIPETLIFIAHSPDFVTRIHN